MIMVSGWGTTLIMFSGRGTLLTGLTLMTWSAKTTIPITKWAVPTGCNKTEKLTLLL